MKKMPTDAPIKIAWHQHVISKGLEMLSRLRQDPSLSRTVAFILTASNSDEDKFLADK
jgi:CheY-like chemotaxis protein